MNISLLIKTLSFKKNLLTRFGPMISLMVICLNPTFSQIEELGVDVVSPRRSNSGPTVNDKEYTLVWVSPNPDHHAGGIINANSPSFHFEIRAFGNPIDASDFTIYHNGSRNGSRYGNNTLRGTTFSGAVNLTPGENTIEVRAGASRSTTLQVHYSAGKPNLYVTSFGVYAPDLQFTQKDADDFTTLFNGLTYKTNKPFSRIRVNNLNTKSETTPSQMLGAIEELYARYMNGEVTSNDVFVLHVAAHGFLDGNGKLRIQASNYDPLRKLSTSVAFEDMIAQLDQVPVKKIIMLDACHSGARGPSAADINNAITTIVSRKAGLTVMASCRAQESSYEDSAWQNGAFTQAAIDGLNGAADSDYDHIITINELFQYIRSKVPAMVKSEKNQLQTPNIIVNELGGDFPIFVY